MSTFSWKKNDTSVCGGQEFIVTPYKGTFLGLLSEGKFIKFDNKTKIWSLESQIANCTTKVSKLRSRIRSIDNSNKLYVCCYGTSTFYSKDEQNNWTTFGHSCNAGWGADLMIINDELHIIGGSANEYHLRLNQKTTTFDELCKFKYRFINHGLAKTADKLLMFGGYNTDNIHLPSADNIMEGISQYDIKLNKWSALSKRLPQKMHSFGCVSIFEGQYVLLVGGIIWPHKVSDLIWIYEVSTQKFRKSIIKCPPSASETKYYAFTLNNREDDKLIIDGFMREQMKVNNLHIPLYLIQLIANFYWNEFVHLFNRDRVEGEGKVHWEIDVFDLMQT